jgi:hypothetical protein
MPRQSAEALANVHPQMLRMRGEADRKKFADCSKEAVGRALERAIAMSGLSKQEAAFAMGYSDPGTVSRWCAGTERLHVDKVMAVADLRQPFALQLAKLSGAKVTVGASFEEAA